MRDSKRSRDSNGAGFLIRLATLIVFLAAICRAEQSCPWLNAATATGVLGGEVKSQVIGDSCTFMHESSELRIEVHTVTLPHPLNCGANPAPLKAIGNEALICSPRDNVEQVAGRVRERTFFIRLTSDIIPRDALREKARLIAEQVAGILF